MTTALIEPVSSYWQRSTSFLTSADWLREALFGLRRLAEFPEDWDGYGSPALTGAAVSQSRQVILELARAGVLSPDIRPVSGGGLQLEWRHAGRELELGVLPNGDLEFLVVLDGNHMVEGALPRAELAPKLFDWVFGG
jgi:hypothetical protein